MGLGLGLEWELGLGVAVGLRRPRGAWPAHGPSPLTISPSPLTITPECLARARPHVVVGHIGEIQGRYRGDTGEI